MLILSGLLFACSGSKDTGAEGGSTEEVCETSVQNGNATAIINDDSWATSGSTWSLSGTSVQITMPVGGEWQIAIVGQKDLDGVVLSEALEAARFPIG